MPTGGDRCQAMFGRFFRGLWVPSSSREPGGKGRGEKGAKRRRSLWNCRGSRSLKHVGADRAFSISQTHAAVCYHFSPASIPDPPSSIPYPFRLILGGERRRQLHFVVSLLTVFSIYLTPLIPTTFPSACDVPIDPWANGHHPPPQTPTKPGTTNHQSALPISKNSSTSHSLLGSPNLVCFGRTTKQSPDSFRNRKADLKIPPSAFQLPAPPPLPFESTWKQSSYGSIRPDRRPPVRLPSRVTS